MPQGYATHINFHISRCLGLRLLGGLQLGLGLLSLIFLMLWGALHVVCPDGSSIMTLFLSVIFRTIPEVDWNLPGEVMRTLSPTLTVVSVTGTCSEKWHRLDGIRCDISLDGWDVWDTHLNSWLNSHPILGHNWNGRSIPVIASSVVAAFNSLLRNEPIIEKSTVKNMFWQWGIHNYDIHVC